MTGGPWNVLEMVLRSCLRTQEGLQPMKKNRTTECGAQYQPDKVMYAVYTPRNGRVCLWRPAGALQGRKGEDCFSSAAGCAKHAPSCPACPSPWETVITIPSCATSLSCCRGLGPSQDGESSVPRSGAGNLRMESWDSAGTPAGLGAPGWLPPALPNSD